MLDKRLNDKGKNWRHVAKALTVLDFLVRTGSEDTVRWSRENLYIIKTLREFQFIDDEEHDHGSIVRVKAKELTSLLRDDERLRQERELRANRRNRRNQPRRKRSDDDDDGEDEEEDELAKALRESKRTAELDEQRRLQSVDEDDSLATALRLSKEEEEARRQREGQTQNLLDLSGSQPQYGVQYDIWGNPIDPNYLALQQQQQQQQEQQAYLLQQQQLAQQQQEQEWLQQQYLQQQYLQQQQLLAQQQNEAQQQYLLAQQQQQQQQQLPLKTGSNNPFAIGQQETAQQYQQPPPQPQPQPQPQQQAQAQPKLNKVPTGSQKKNEQFSELNQLLAQGTGIDTFGNEGNLRIPAQFTQTGTFINSSGTGIRDNNGRAGNPFLNTQYTGVVSTGIVPSYTGYGFGNQNQQQQAQPQSQIQQGGSSRNGEQSLIDI